MTSTIALECAGVALAPIALFLHHATNVWSRPSAVLNELAAFDRGTDDPRTPTPRTCQGSLYVMKELLLALWRPWEYARSCSAMTTMGVGSVASQRLGRKARRCSRSSRSKSWSACGLGEPKTNSHHQLLDIRNQLTLSGGTVEPLDRRGP